MTRPCRGRHAAGEGYRLEPPGHEEWPGGSPARFYLRVALALSVWAFLTVFAGWAVAQWWN